MAFCQVPQMDGKDAAHKYDVALSRLVPQLEKTIARPFPHLPLEKRKVTMGDVEPCLFGAFIYSKMVEKLRESLPCGRLGPAESHRESNWGAVCKLRVPAGFTGAGIAPMRSCATWLSMSMRQQRRNSNSKSNNSNNNNSSNNKNNENSDNSSDEHAERSKAY
ncbi:unnamed protein product [Polarella glacialis]|uniref:Uncharacterized protein n=1 Tax=Polarella glacialis TaxID=89957 RepID=A0A813EDH1_POLGL|nr:unnamed protein product [Polarella glacialis]